jgi:DNA-3-methyladenine glycosylase II
MDASFVVPGPVDIAGTLSRYRLWGEDPVNRLSDRVFRRAIKWEGRWRGYELRWSDDAHAARLTISVPGARSAGLVDAAVAEARHVCGLDLDLAPFYAAAADDAVLGGLISRFRGLRPTLSPGAFEMLVGSVCAQQVNLTFAFTVRARIVRRFGEPLLIGGEAVYSFPEPATLARASVEELRRLQLTTRKAEYVVGLARQIVSGELDLARLPQLSNHEVIERLTAVRGFGRWSAEWFLARGLGRGDVCPAGDLGVRRAFEHFYGRGRLLSEEAIRRRSARWGGHQNLAVHYLLAGRRMATATAAGGGA